MLGFGSIGEFPLGGADDASNVRVDAESPMVLTITGQDATLTVMRYLSIGTAAYTITGSDIDMVKGRRGLRVLSGGGGRGLRASSGGGSRGLRIRA